MGPTDPLEWAKHPRSEAALRSIVEGSKKSRRLRAILEELKATRVCTPDADRLLVRWDGARWVPN